MGLDFGRGFTALGRGLSQYAQFQEQRKARDQQQINFERQIGLQESGQEFSQDLSTKRFELQKTGQEFGQDLSLRDFGLREKGFGERVREFDITQGFKESEAGRSQSNLDRSFIQRVMESTQTNELGLKRLAQQQGQFETTEGRLTSQGDRKLELQGIGLNAQRRLIAKDQRNVDVGNAFNDILNKFQEKYPSSYESVIQNFGPIDENTSIGTIRSLHKALQTDPYTTDNPSFNEDFGPLFDKLKDTRRTSIDDYLGGAGRLKDPTNGNKVSNKLGLPSADKISISDLNKWGSKRYSKNRWNALTKEQKRIAYQNSQG